MEWCQSGGGEGLTRSSQCVELLERCLSRSRAGQRRPSRSISCPGSTGGSFPLFVCLSALGGDLLVAVAAIMLEDGSEREDRLAPGFIGFEEQASLIDVEVQIAEIAAVSYDHPALRIEVIGQIAEALQPSGMLFDLVPVDTGGLVIAGACVVGAARSPGAGSVRSTGALAANP